MLVWLGIEFIALQTSEYIQQTSKLIYTNENSRRFLNLHLNHKHQLDIPMVLT